jgi:hypothetical protein
MNYCLYRAYTRDLEPARLEISRTGRVVCPNPPSGWDILMNLKYAG